ncbi:class I adenylate-forming enzyme family protein [Nonomuraea pusilla]|uniref:Acyl-CoA synthetase (AMP-forming)/AMP-acid ligase II n=1 Tax=Nonomuraea pusilla TaxID=46177 RepID=A0A1H8A0A6_9ACTN|nr:class I adenylate-forming enzyme family protein [Nonomuraea pusilla]SEM63209.1 Acyl-CoA synthetase (AMP-forming)/AMP-acid ligase II [Nonomuraea pusilla]
MPPTIGDVIRAGAARHPTREALVHDARRWTWQDLDAEVDRWAGTLVEAGVRAGDRVAVAAHPEPRFLFAFLAAARLGAVFQGLNPKSRPHELRYLLDDSEPRVVLDPAGLLEGAGLEQATLAGDELSRALRAATPLAADPAVDPGAAALIVYTSGSTGRPKGALLSHTSLIATARIQGGRIFTGEAPSMLCNLPINHVGSVGNICMTVLVAGGRLVFQDAYDPRGALELLERERVEYWGAVPTMLQLSVATDLWPRADLSQLRAILWSGGAAPQALVSELRRRCGRLLMSYGSTETVGEVCFADPDADDDVLTRTIGRPAAEYEVRLLGQDGAETPAGEPGEIVVRGACRALGYWRDPAATSRLIDADGWLHTGDLAVRRPDGNLELVGRTHEVFKSGGYNVYPREIELALEAHPAVQVAAVLPVPDELYGQVGHAWVQSPGGAGPDELLAHLRHRLAAYKVPKRLTVVSELPLLDIGKVDKRALAGR